MTKDKQFKRMVRAVAKRTGQSYAATRARLEKRRREGAGDEPPDPPRLAALPPEPPGPYDLMITLAAEIDRAASEFRDERRLGTAVPYARLPETLSALMPERARELRTRLLSLSDRDLFVALVLMIWGKTPFLTFAEVIADARNNVDHDGIDYGSDYVFRKLPEGTHFFRDGLASLQREGITPEACWYAGFGYPSAPDGGRLLRRRVNALPFG